MPDDASGQDRAADPARPRVTLVVNPAAGHGRARRIGARVADRLRDGCALRVVSGTSWQQSVELLAEAAAEADAVFVCGGDGIVHLAVNVLAEGTVPLGVIPAGSGNDTAAVLGLPIEPVAAADELLTALRAQSVQRIDLGFCQGNPLMPGASGRWFVGILYAGLDAAVNERANNLRRPRGPRRYDVAIVLELLRLRPRRIRLTVDGVTSELDVTLIAVGNGPQYGGGKRMTPDARWDDGMFDLTVVGPVSRTTLARLALKLPAAGHIGHPAVQVLRGREVTIGGDAGPAYADGERVGPLPVTVRCVPSALPVLVPVPR